MEYNKILIEIHHGLGDVVQIIPLINNLRENYKNAKISVIVVSKAHKEILDCTGLVDDYYYLNLRKMNIKEIIRFIRQIRKEKYDIGFLSPISNKRIGALLLYILGCKYRVGEESKIKKTLINNNISIEENRNIHRIDRNLNLLTAANIKIYDRNPFMNINHKDTINAKKKIGHLNTNKKLIGICIGTNPVEQKRGFKRIGYDAKKWPLDNYIELIKKISQDYNIVLVGGKKEEEEIKGFSRLLESKDSIVNFINKTTIMESAALLNECDIVIGGDTGMLHIADALGKKTLTIFGPTNPNLVGPYSENSNNVSLNIQCQYCYGKDILYECRDRICLSGITVDYIYNKVIEITKNQ